MKKEWCNPIMKDLKVEETKSNHYPIHYHCSQCGRVLSEAEYNQIQQDFLNDTYTWECQCGGKVYSNCSKVECLTKQS